MLLMFERAFYTVANAIQLFMTQRLFCQQAGPGSIGAQWRQTDQVNLDPAQAELLHIE